MGVMPPGAVCRVPRLPCRPWVPCAARVPVPRAVCRRVPVAPWVPLSGAVGACRAINFRAIFRRCRGAAAGAVWALPVARVAPERVAARNARHQRDAPV